MSKAPVPLSQIPSITALYTTNRLASPSTYPRKAASAALNDRISIYKGDITVLQLDAIVNAANSRMLGGGGIDGAIHTAAGGRLREECATFPVGPDGRCPTGEARITSGHDLPAKYIIHAVGPNCNKPEEKLRQQQLLKSVYDNILKLAADTGVRSLAICGISTAIFGYPPMDACNVACDRVRRFMEKEENNFLERVVFVTFSQKDVDAYNAVLPRWFPPVKDEKAETDEGEKK